jgi:hypothetical protein
MALRRRDAARTVGMSVDSFARWVQPHLRVIRRGQMVLIPVTELRRWVREEARRDA